MLRQISQPRQTDHIDTPRLDRSRQSRRRLCRWNLVNHKRRVLQLGQQRTQIPINQRATIHRHHIRKQPNRLGLISLSSSIGNSRSSRSSRSSRGFEFWNQQRSHCQVRNVNTLGIVRFGHVVSPTTVLGLCHRLTHHHRSHVQRRRILRPRRNPLRRIRTLGGRRGSIAIMPTLGRSLVAVATPRKRKRLGPLVVKKRERLGIQVIRHNLLCVRLGKHRKPKHRSPRPVPVDEASQQREHLPPVVLGNAPKHRLQRNLHPQKWAVALEKPHVIASSARIRKRKHQHLHTVGRYVVPSKAVQVLNLEHAIKKLGDRKQERSIGIVIRKVQAVPVRHPRVGFDDLLKRGARRDGHLRIAVHLGKPDRLADTAVLAQRQ